MEESLLDDLALITETEADLLEPAQEEDMDFTWVEPNIPDLMLTSADVRLIFNLIV